MYGHGLCVFFPVWFFILFPCCGGEAGHFPHRFTATVVILFHLSLLLAFSLHFSSACAVLRVLCLENPPIFTEVFLIFATSLLLCLASLFSNLSF